MSYIYDHVCVKYDLTWSYTSYLTVTHIYDIQLGDTSWSLADSSSGVDIITKYHKMPVSNDNITIHLLVL